MRRHRPALALMIGMALAPAWVAMAQTPGAAQTPDTALRLGAGDRLNVLVFGQPELSGEFVIDTQGNIVLPIGGVVPAAEATPAELQQRITETLADGFILRPRVSVRAVELRPIYVVGDVRVSGALPFRIGMTALAAIAMAGGHASADPLNAGFRGDLVDAEERVGLLETQRATVLARIARLEAQRQGAATLDFPRALLDLGPDMQRILAGERAIFDAEREAEAREVTQAEQQRAGAEAEMASLAEQIRLEQGQLQVAQGYQREMTALARNGLVDRRRLVDSQREVARIESSLARLVTESGRAAQLSQDAPRRLAQLRGVAEQRVVTGLQEAVARLAEIENGIAAGREQIALRSQRIGAATAAAGRAGAPPEILVTRVRAGVTTTIQAEENTPLQPGDILRVAGGGGMRVTGATPPGTNQNFIRRQ